MNITDFTLMRSWLDKHVIELLKSGFDENEIIKANNLIEKLKKVELLDFHKSIAQRQRDSYNYLRANVPEDTLFIEFDFKEKVKVGLSPEQISQEFFNLKTRYVLGNLDTKSFNGLKIKSYHLN